MKNYDTEKTTKNYDLEKTALDPPDLPPKNYPSSLLLPRPESLLTEAEGLLIWLTEHVPRLLP